MEEYEVELIDYLRVIWKGKWIILTCLVVAVAAAIAISFLRPNTYETKGVYKLSSLPQLGSISIRMPSMVDVLAILRSRDLMQQVVTSDRFPREGWPEETQNQEIVDWLVGNINAENPGGDLIKISLAGFKPPHYLKDLLLRVVEEFNREIFQHVMREIEREEMWLEARAQVLSARFKEIEAEISNEAGLLDRDYQEQIKSIQEKMRAIEQASPPDLLVGENTATLAGYIVRERYRSLIDQLLPLQEQLDSLRVNKRAFFPERYSELDLLKNRIQDTREEQAYLEEIAHGFERGSFALVVFESPAALESPLGSNRKLTAAVAAILGLFVGILLAFFVNYIATVREREKRPAKP